MELTNEQKARLFDAMEADGVDNWDNYQGDNYQETMEEIEAEANFEENKKRLEPLFDIINEYDSLDVEEPAGHGAGYGWSITPSGEEEIVKFITKNYEPKT